MTDSRERRFGALTDATGEKTKSKALDTAVGYYLKMSGGGSSYPTGRVEKLMQLADQRGSVTAAEIAEVLDTDELSVDFDQRWSVGD
ncbi:hypothetical protein ACFQE1_03500 [Halobium palmae]|uniref:Uncharacterized protein n=1 Tax=Halobium palmae TaxID=1776492 RepID=A0ABD5RWS8_9EURY